MERTRLGSTDTVITAKKKPVSGTLTVEQVQGLTEKAQDLNVGEPSECQEDTYASSSCLAALAHD